MKSFIVILGASVLSLMILLSVFMLKTQNIVQRSNYADYSNLSVVGYSYQRPFKYITPFNEENRNIIR